MNGNADGGIPIVQKHRKQIHIVALWKYSDAMFFKIVIDQKEIHSPASKA